MSGEVVRRRRKKGGQRRREEEEREEKEEQREEEEPILVTDAAAKEDLTDGGTHSTLVKSLFLAGILGQQLFQHVTLIPQVVILGVILVKCFLIPSMLWDWVGWRGEGRL